MAFCVRCGAQVQDGTGFCPQCGAQIMAAGTPAAGEWDPAPETRAVRRRKTVSGRQMLLKIMSIVFAVLVVFFSIGLGGRIYIGRVVDKRVFYSESDRLNNAERLVHIQQIAALGRNDAKGFLSLMVRQMEIEGRNSTSFSASSDGSYITVNHENYEDREIVEATQRMLEQARKEYAEKSGFQWFLLVVSSCYQIVMLICGLLAIGTAIAWYILGGRISRLSETAVPLAILICAGVALAILLMFCFVSPVIRGKTSYL